MAKIYTKKTWVDEVLTGEETYELKNDADAVVYDNCKISLATTSTLAGTPVNAANMNNLEEGVDDLDDLVVALFIEPIYLKPVPEADSLTVGDGVMIFTVPDYFDGWEINDVDIAVYTVSSSGIVSVQLYNLTTSNDILSTNATLAVGDFNSYEAGNTPCVVNATHKALTKGNRIRIDVDAIGTGVKGLDIIIKAQKA